MIMLFLGKETEKIYNSQQDKKKKPSQPSLQGFAFGTPAGGRTLDTLIKSQVLYQLSYGSIVLRVQKYNLFSFPQHFFSKNFPLFLQFVVCQIIKSALI